MTLLSSNPDFRNLWAAGVLSLTGSQISRIALVLHVFHQTSSLTDIALLIALENVPGIVCVPFAGVVVDRVNKRLVMILSDVGRIVCLAAIILHPSHPVIFVMIALHACGNFFFEPAKTASVPLVVSAADLPRANGLEQGSNHLVLIAGPLIGAELFTRAGLTAALMIDIGTFLGSILLLSRVRVRETGRRAAFAARATFGDMADGWRYIIRRQVVRHLVLMFFVSLLCVGLWLPLAPFFISDFLKGSDRLLGLQFAMFGCGGVIGALCVPALAARFGKGAVLSLALLLEGLTMALYSLVPNPAVSVGICLFWGVVVSAILVPYYSIMQERVEEGFLGRVFSVARQGESAATLLSVGIAVALHGVFSSNQILFAAGVAYTSIIALSAATLAGRELMQTR